MHRTYYRYRLSSGLSAHSSLNLRLGELRNRLLSGSSSEAYSNDLSRCIQGRILLPSTYGGALQLRGTGQHRAVPYLAYSGAGADESAMNSQPTQAPRSRARWFEPGSRCTVPRGRRRHALRRAYGGPRFHERQVFLAWLVDRACTAPWASKAELVGVSVIRLDRRTLGQCYLHMVFVGQAGAEAELWRLGVLGLTRRSIYLRPRCGQPERRGFVECAYAAVPFAYAIYWTSIFADSQSVAVPKIGCYRRDLRRLESLHRFG